MSRFVWAEDELEVVESAKGYAMRPTVIHVPKFNPHHVPSGEHGGEFTFAPDTGMGGAPADHERELKTTIKKAGLKWVTPDKLPKQLQQQMPVKAPANGYTQDHVLAAEGIQEAVATLGEQKEFAPLVKHLNEIRFAAGDYNPKGASMSMVTGGPYPILLMNTNADPRSLYVTGKTNPFSYSAKVADALGRAGNIDGAIKVEYKLSTFHEFGHMIDAMNDRALTNGMGDYLIAHTGGDLPKVVKFITTHISDYAATNPRDTAAEAFSMYMNKALPKEFEPWREMVNLPKRR